MRALNNSVRHDIYRGLTLLPVSHHLSPERRAQFTGVYELETVSA